MRHYQLLTLAASVWVSIWVDPHSAKHYPFPISLWKEQVATQESGFPASRYPPPLASRAPCWKGKPDAGRSHRAPSSPPPRPIVAVSSPQHSQAFYAQAYAVIVGVMTLMGLLRMFGMALGALRASTYLHNTMVSTLLHTTCRFFDLNPVGRLMNRCGPW